jgi:predicted anti-sigma-YlaC factor YlaD
MLRLITCQNATLLLEQQTDGLVAKETRSSLWLHLRYCPYCNRYAKQSVLITQMARAAAAARATSGPALPEAAKERMRQRLAGV